MNAALTECSEVYPQNKHRDLAGTPSPTSQGAVMARPGTDERQSDKATFVQAEPSR